MAPCKRQKPFHFLHTSDRKQFFFLTGTGARDGVDILWLRRPNIRYSEAPLLSNSASCIVRYCHLRQSYLLDATISWQHFFDWMEFVKWIWQILSNEKNAAEIWAHPTDTTVASDKIWAHLSNLSFDLMLFVIDVLLPNLYNQDFFDFYWNPKTAKKTCIQF